MKIVLFCSGGYSTSLLVNKMIAAGKDINLDVEVSAHSVVETLKYGMDADVILLGPQIRFRLDKVIEDVYPTPVGVIEMRSYGIADGMAVLKQALGLLQ